MVTRVVVPREADLVRVRRDVSTEVRARAACSGRGTGWEREGRRRRDDGCGKADRSDHRNLLVVGVSQSYEEHVDRRAPRTSTVPGRARVVVAFSER
jgi:hypothetical protein